MIRNATLLAVTASLALASGASADVLTVDDDAPADFTSIGDAVAAASAGDTILVYPGTYNPETIHVEKSLTITDVAGDVIVQGNLTVTQLAATDRVVVRGLSTGQFLLLRILVDDCAGNVWIEDCVLNSPLEIRDSSNVVVLDSEVAGQISPFGGASDFPGIESFDSVLYVHGTTLRAGNGNPGDCILGTTLGATGPAGARIHGGTAFFFSCVLEGGQGGDLNPTPPTCTSCTNGKGGAGLRVTGDGEVFANHTVLTPGTGGNGGCAPGQPGSSTSIAPGSTFEVLPGNERSLAVSGTAEAGTPISITVHAHAGDTTLLYGSLTPALTPLVETLDNVGLIAPAVYFLGSTSDPSPAQIPFTFPPLPPGTGITGYFQGISITALGLPRLTAPAATTFLGT